MGTHFLELVSRRKSVRSFLDRPVEREKIDRCLEAARLAPSASNSQPWSFVVVDEPPQRQAVARKTFGPLLSFNRFTLQAPVLVAVVSRPGKLITRIGGLITRREYRLIDIGIAAEHFCLQAVEEGLGSCMLGWFDEKAVKKILGIPAGRRIDLLIALGYPGESVKRPKNRRTLDQIRSFNRYSL